MHCSMSCCTRCSPWVSGVSACVTSMCPASTAWHIAPSSSLHAGGRYPRVSCTAESASGGGASAGGGMSRRVLLGASALVGSGAWAQLSGQQHVQAESLPANNGAAQVGVSLAEGAISMPDYAAAGPFKTGSLPRLEHTCSTCFPQCIGDKCRMRIDVTYPKNPISQGYHPPFPLAIISSGFLVPAENYTSYAKRLASWGYVVMQYDKTETFNDNLDDDLSVALIRELINWAETDPTLKQCADTERVYLCGHSRGGKLSALAAAADNRIAALCLIDPVDNTQYAPLGPGYPSAVQALKNLERDRYLSRQSRPLPIAIIGSGLGADCAPREANYTNFFDASSSPSWEVVIKDSGHFQFVDSRSLMIRNFCAEGSTPDEAIKAATQAVMVAWGETMVKGRKGIICTDHPAEDGTSTALTPDTSLCVSDLDISNNSNINIQGLDLIAGYPNLQLASQLFETQGAAARILTSGGYQQGVALQLSSRIKGFSL